MTIKTIATHNGQFHADEVTAIALLQLFKKVAADTQIIRTREQHNIENTDLVLDVGRVYDVDLLRFDHHQISNGKISSAGMIWQWIKTTHQANYPMIDQLISEIDAHDCGITRMANFSYSHLISTLNDSDPFNEKAQTIAFTKALDIAYSMLKTLQQEQDALVSAEHLISQQTLLAIGQQKVLFLPDVIPVWKSIVHGESEYAQVTRVVWYVPQKDQWFVQVPALKKGSFQLAYPPLQADNNAVFVHSNGFLAVYPTKMSVLEMLEKGR